MLTTQLLTMNIPMPVCKYEVLANGPTGNKVTYAKIGDHVYHKWSCASETSKPYTVHQMLLSTTS